MLKITIIDNNEEQIVKKTKQIIGILLIISAIAALVYWETGGRNRVMTVRVLAAGENIEQGAIMTKQMLFVVNAMPETVIEGALAPGDIHKIEGKEAALYIAKNQQISGLFLREPEKQKTKKQSPFLIKSEWIDSRSSSLRKGDIISMYSRDGSYYLGDFETACVKDAADKEIVENGIVDHFEVLTDIGGYQNILHFIDTSGEKLLVVQKEVKQ